MNLIMLFLKIEKMNHIDAVSKVITYQTIAHGFDLIQHYIVGRPMLKPTPKIF